MIRKYVNKSANGGKSMWGTGLKMHKAPTNMLQIHTLTHTCVYAFSCMPSCAYFCCGSLVACGTTSCWCYQPFDGRWLRLAALQCLWRVRHALYCAFAIVVAHFLHALLLISIIRSCCAVNCNRCGLLLLLLTFVAGVWQLVLMFHFQHIVFRFDLLISVVFTLVINALC